MAEIEYVNLSIVRTSTSAGHSCMAEYSYHLHSDNREYTDNTSFKVGCVLFGHDMFHDKTLGDPPFDLHTVSSHDPMPVKRHFMIPCDVLNEAWGRDDIFLRLFVATQAGVNLSKDSATVSDWF